MPPIAEVTGRLGRVTGIVELTLDAIDLQKNPVDGFSAGLVDDENILEWQIVIMG